MRQIFSSVNVLVRTAARPAQYRSPLGRSSYQAHCLMLTHFIFPTGQPIIVSNVSKQMKVNELWSPEAFSREFGHVRHDLIDCRRNEPLTGYQIKCFWDGFEDASSELHD